MKITIVKQLEDSGNIYQVGDRIRIMLSNNNEHIAVIEDIMPHCIIISISMTMDTKQVLISDIKKIRLATDNESFYNKFKF